MLELHAGLPVDLMHHMPTWCTDQNLCSLYCCMLSCICIPYTFMTCMNNRESQCQII